jgi:MarR family transcriptional regulator for hemolysin
VRLGFLIHDVSRLRRNAFDRLMRPLGVTRSQWWVLAYLSRHDGMMQTELAELLDVGKVTLGGLIDRLEAGGWVMRRADKDDRRVKRIFLTGNTDKLFKQMRSAENKLSDELLSGISPAECDELFDVLARMKNNLVKLGAGTGMNSGVEEDDI